MPNPHINFLVGGTGTNADFEGAGGGVGLEGETKLAAESKDGLYNVEECVYLVKVWREEVTHLCECKTTASKIF